MKGKMLLRIALFISILTIVGTVMYWTSQDVSTSTGIALAIVVPTYLCLILGTVFNAIALFGYSRPFALAGAILYCVAILFMPIYFFNSIVQAILCFIAFARMTK